MDFPGPLAMIIKGESSSTSSKDKNGACLSEVIMFSVLVDASKYGRREGSGQVVFVSAGNLRVGVCGSGMLNSKRPCSS